MAHICPIDGTRINEPTVRVVAFLVVITTIVGIVFQSPVIFLLLTADFLIRGFYNKQWSVFRSIGVRITDALDFKPKLIDAGGKKFAAKIGFFITASLTISSIFEWYIALTVLGAVLIFFATLESAFAYCVGCKLYPFYLKAASKLSNPETLN